MMTTPCEKFADRIVDYVDGELESSEAQVVAQHLKECDRCRHIAEALERSLGLAQALWRDNLEGPAARRLYRAHGFPGRVRLWCVRHTVHFAVAASILLITGLLLIPVSHRGSSDQALAADQIERRVARVGMAAELLAATRIVAQCEGTESIVKQQYRYILREYADTPAAASIQANEDLELGGTAND